MSRRVQASNRKRVSRVEEQQHALAPSPMAPIDAAMEQLESQADALSDVVSELRTKLGRVLSPAMVGQVGDGNEDPMPVESDLRRRLNATTVHLNGIAVELRDLIDRVEC